MKGFSDTFNRSIQGLWDYLPALIGGIVCFVATLFVANFVSRLVSKFALKRTKDSLISNFTGKIFWTIVFTLGVVLTLGILGLGTISNKILAAAGITTFVVGFALRDIGENFLAGLMLAFGRPFHVGNVIECAGISGSVKDMTLRQTTVETSDGKLVMIPNSYIIKNPLSIYKKSDIISDGFSLKVETGQSRKAIDVIEKTINDSKLVVNTQDKNTKAMADGLTNDKIHILVTYWTDALNTKTPRSDLKSELMQKVIEQLETAGIKYSG